MAQVESGRKPEVPQSAFQQVYYAARPLKLHVLHASSEHDFDAVFAALGQRWVRSLLISPDILFRLRLTPTASSLLRSQCGTKCRRSSSIAHSPRPAGS
jgi:hypothetical protein